MLKKDQEKKKEAKAPAEQNGDQDARKNMQDALKDLKKESKKTQEYREFIPHQVAERIVEFISFSVKISGRCPDIEKIEDPKTMSALEILER